MTALWRPGKYTILALGNGSVGETDTILPTGMPSHEVVSKKAALYMMLQIIILLSASRTAELYLAVGHGEVLQVQVA